MTAPVSFQFAIASCRTEFRDGGILYNLLLKRDTHGLMSVLKQEWILEINSLDLTALTYCWTAGSHYFNILPHIIVQIHFCVVLWMTRH